MNSRLDFIEFLEGFYAKNEKLPPYEGGPFEHYENGDIKRLKRDLIALISAYLEKHAKDLERTEVNDIELLLANLKASKQYSAIYTHLSIAKVRLKEVTTFSILIDYIRDFPRFTLDVQKMKEKTPQLHRLSSRSESEKTEETEESADNDEKSAAVYHNPIEAAVFETDLAHAILNAAPRNSLEKINRAIVEYCTQHREILLAEKESVLRDELIKYHVCSPRDFEDTNGLDKFLALLQRPLSDVNNLAEFATLHLVFFNYKHIYDPTYEVDEPKDKLEIERERDSIHQQVRPNQSGEMFDSMTRGRQRVSANVDTKEFGITDPDNVPKWGRKWHKNATTPHKYRAALNLESPIIKSFRSNGIPYIAGPSGTAADCAEGLHFLIPELGDEEINEYFNLLAAAEIAQGHHSIHEIIMPLCNLGLFRPFLETLDELSDKKQVARREEYEAHPWAYFDYQRSYEAFLTAEFKETAEYAALCKQYPQYLDKDRLVAEPIYTYLNKHHEKQAIRIQRFLRARKNYAELDKGTFWRESDLISSDKINLQRFKQLSSDNVKRLEADLELKSLTAEEKKFMRELMKQSIELSHYTNSADKIMESGVMLSNTMLKQMLGDGYFTNNSASDVARLANGGSVFFRYELSHQTGFLSRFGNEQIILDADVTSLFQTGWVSLYEMLAPSTISIVKELAYSGEVLRSYGGSYADGKILFNYGSKSYDFDVVGTVFYGPDIKRGIALAAIRELRRIGGQYQSERLNEITKEALNATLVQLFRVEAKVPSLTRIDSVKYTYTAPKLMQDAIDSESIETIKNILDKGMPVDDTLAMGLSAAFYTCSLYRDSVVDILTFLHQQGARLINEETTAAHVAASYGNVSCLTYCLDNGVEVNAKDKHGRAPFSYACEHAQWETIKLLTGRGVTPVFEDLIHIVKAGHIDILEKLMIEFRGSMNELIKLQDDDGNGLVHIAAQHGFTSIITYLLENAVSLDEKNKLGQTPLHLAATTGKHEVIDLMVKKKIDLDQKDHEGNTALHLAARHNEPISLSLLLQHQANSNIPNSAGCVPICIALDSDSQESVNVLLKHDEINFNAIDNDGNGLLHIAAKRNNVDALRVLLPIVSAVDKENDKGETALHLAIMNNNGYSVSQILNYKPDLYKLDKQGVSAIQKAALKSDAEIFAMICRHLGNKKLDELIEEMNLEGDETLKSAILSYFSDGNWYDTHEVLALIEKGADPARPDPHGRIPLLTVIKNDSFELFQLFFERGNVNWNAKNQDGLTPIQVASEYGRADMVDLLLSKKEVDYTLTNNEGCTALDNAIIKKQNDVVNVFISHSIMPSLNSIFEVVRSGNTELLHTFLDKFFSPTMPDENKMTAFHIAAETGNEEIISILYKKTKRDGLLYEFIKNLEANDINIELTLMLYVEAYKNSDEEMLDLLMLKDINFNLAISQNNIKVARILLARGESPYIKNELGQTPLHFAASSGNKKFMQLFLSDEEKMIDIEDNEGMTPLHYALVSNASCEMIDYLIANGADVNHLTLTEGKSPLHLAVRGDNLEVISRLIDGGANFNQGDSNGNTPVHLAVLENGNAMKMINCCMRAGADFNIKNALGQSPLFVACLSNDIDSNLFYALLNAGSDPDSEDEEKLIAMARQLYNKDSVSNDLFFDSLHSEGLFKLIDQLNESDTWITDRLMQVIIRKGYADALEDLIEKVVDINAEDDFGLTYIQLACMMHEGVSGIVSVLLNHGSNPNITNVNSIVRGDVPAISLAIQYSTFEVVSLILNNDVTKVDIEIPDRKSMRPLHYAAKNGDKNILRMILDHGANVNVVAYFDRTPLAYAVSEGNSEAIIILMESGADPFFIPNKNYTVFDESLDSRDPDGILRLLFDLSDKRSLIDYISESCIDREVLKRFIKFSIEDNNVDVITAIANRQDLTKNLTRMIYELSEKTELQSIISNANKNDIFLEQIFEAALSYDDIETMQFLYDINPGLLDKTDLYIPDINHDVTLLHLAAFLGKSKSVQFLLEKGMDPVGTNVDGYTPVHMAARSDQEDVIELLLKEHSIADIEETSSALPTPLATACSKGCFHAAKILLEKGANLHQIDSAFHNATMLHLAVVSNNPELVELLLSKGIDPTVVDANHISVLFAARNLKIAEMLLECGLEPTENNDYFGYSPFSMTSRERIHDVFELYYHNILASGKLLAFIETLKADFDANEEQLKLDILSIAIREYHVDVIEAIIKNSNRSQQAAFLTYYISQASTEGVSLLLAGDNDLGNVIMDSNGHTPFAHAIRYGDENIIDLILNNCKVDIDKPVLLDGQRFPPLAHAIAFNNIGLVKYFLKSDANQNATIGDMTLLDLALLNFSDDIAIVLIDNGCHLMYLNNEGSTPVERALVFGQSRCLIHMLVQLDAGSEFSEEFLTKLRLNSNYIVSEFIRYMKTLKTSDPTYLRLAEMIAPEQTNQLAILFNKTKKSPILFHSDISSSYDIIRAELNLKNPNEKGKEKIKNTTIGLNLSDENP